jgi:hypothetical protein
MGSTGSALFDNDNFFPCEELIKETPFVCLPRMWLCLHDEAFYFRSTSQLILLHMEMASQSRPSDNMTRIMRTLDIPSDFQLTSTVFIGPWPSLMDFSIHRHLVGLLGWGISPTQGPYRNTGQHNTKTRRHTSMPRAGFEPAISMFKRS